MSRQLLILLASYITCIFAVPLGQRMIQQADVQEEKIWLLLQRDVNWPDDATFEVSVEKLPSRRGRLVQSPVTWDTLLTQSVTDGDLKGWTCAVLIDNLKPATSYNVIETVRRSDGQVIYANTDTYRTDGNNVACRKMNVCKNSEGAWVPAARAKKQDVLQKLLDAIITTTEKKKNKMIYQSDIGKDRIWLIMQRDVKWPDDITFEVSVKDPNGVERIAQEPITWQGLGQQFVTDGKRKGWPFAVLVDGLSPGTSYDITETVRQSDGSFYWTKTTTLKTLGGSSSGNSPNRLRCHVMKVCPVGDGTYVPYGQ